MNVVVAIPLDNIVIGVRLYSAENCESTRSIVHVRPRQVKKHQYLPIFPPFSMDRALQLYKDSFLLAL